MGAYSNCEMPVLHPPTAVFAQPLLEQYRRRRCTALRCFIASHCVRPGAIQRTHGAPPPFPSSLSTRALVEPLWCQPRSTLHHQVVPVGGAHVLLMRAAL